MVRQAEGGEALAVDGGDCGDGGGHCGGYAGDGPGGDRPGTWSSPSFGRGGLLAITGVFLCGGSFLLGVWVTSLDTVSKGGMRMAIAEISQQCGQKAKP